MSIIVIEQGRPDGTDFVMGEHLDNPLAQAKKAGQRIVEVIDLGDDFGLAGISIRPTWDETKENLCFVLVVAAGPTSKLVGIQAVPVVVGELARIPIADLRASVARALQPPEQA